MMSRIMKMDKKEHVFYHENHEPFRIQTVDRGNPVEGELLGFLAPTELFLSVHVSPKAICRSSEDHLASICPTTSDPHVGR